GVMGASAALAAKRAGMGEVAGFDADPAALATAVERGAVDERCASLEAAAAGVDLVLVAVPVSALPATVGAVLAAAPEGCTVTDVGSPKSSGCAAAGGSPPFLGGPPLLGVAGGRAEAAAPPPFQGASSVP